MAQINLSQARELCTAAELRLVASARQSSLAKMSEAELKKGVSQARKLRDKWRDQATRQRRSAQQKKGARTTDASARSREKSELFADVLARFEARLGSQPAGAKGRSATVATKKPKRDRALVHRATRAQERERLETKRQKLEDEKTAKSKRAAKKPATRKTPEAVATTDERATETAPPSGQKAKPAKWVPPLSLPKKNAGKGARPVNSPRTVASTKKTRLKLSGIESRIRGHVSGRGKRSQARRDTRR